MMDTATSTKANEATARAKPGKYLGFSLDEQLFGVEILKVREIVCGLAVTPVPRATRAVRGVINLRGKIIPVVDLRVKLGMSPAIQHDRTCFVVVDVVKDAVETQIGVLVDAVSEVLNVRAEDIVAAPDYGSSMASTHILGVAQMKGTVRLLLGIQEILEA